MKSESVKPSKELDAHDIIAIKHPPTERLYKVLDFPKSRVGAKLVPLYLEEITPKENIDIIDEINEQKKFNAYHGLKGRPTKRDRRDMIKILKLRNYDPED